MRPPPAKGKSVESSSEDNGLDSALLAHALGKGLPPASTAQSSEFVAENESELVSNAQSKAPANSDFVDEEDSLI